MVQNRLGVGFTFYNMRKAASSETKLNFNLMKYINNYDRMMIKTMTTIQKTEYLNLNRGTLLWIQSKDFRSRNILSYSG